VEPPANEPNHLETLVKLGFSSKRKMLRNNLKSVIESEAQGASSASRLNHLLEQLEVNPQARAEDLSVQQWVALSNKLLQI
jgi:16S rRNA (adenine1518-N6/adenine1519-N6)-dimethyltransferase